MSGVRAFRTPARPSQRDTRAVAGAAIAQSEHNQDILQRGVIPALSLAQKALAEERAARIEADTDAERRLWRHREDIDAAREAVGSVARAGEGLASSLDDLRKNFMALTVYVGQLRAHREAFDRLTLFGRLRWLLTGRVR
jgi:hypothetical protein